jgi:hypothetical protein
MTHHNKYVQKLKRIALTFGIMSNFGFTFYLYYMFLITYLAGAKQFIFSINMFHEAGLEMILLTIMIFCGAFATYCEMTKIKTVARGI